jgi:hypothetical protein
MGVSTFAKKSLKGLAVLSKVNRSKSSYNTGARQRAFYYVEESGMNG